MHRIPKFQPHLHRLSALQSAPSMGPSNAVDKAEMPIPTRVAWNTTRSHIASCHPNMHPPCMRGTTGVERKLGEEDCCSCPLFYIFTVFLCSQRAEKVPSSEMRGRFIVICSGVVCFTWVLPNPRGRHLECRL
jgi:hypothetical protein